MNDASNSNLIYSRRQLHEVPPDLFKIAKKQPIRVLDLGYNYLKDVVCLGDEEEDPKASQRKGVALKMYETPSLKSDVIPRCKLASLEALFLSNNSIDAIPEELFNLVGLKQLWIGANKIARIPPGISALVNLEILSLNNNAVTLMVPQIGHLQNLQQLLIRSNKLGQVQDQIVLPEHLGLLTNLRVLDLADNMIATLPIEFGRLHSSLERLNLEKNPWRFPSGGIIEQGRIKVLTYLLTFYEEKLDRYKMRARERLKMLREQPDALGYTRHEANEILSKRARNQGVMSNVLQSPLELDSGMENL